MAVAFITCKVKEMPASAMKIARATAQTLIILLCDVCLMESEAAASEGGCT